MTFDIHAHLFGTDIRNGNKVDIKGIRSFAGRQMARQLGRSTAAMPPDQLVVEMTLRWIDESMLDRVVLLALDWAHRADGSRDPDRTVIATDNDFVARAASSSPKALFGASIHPYRSDALRELARVANLGACLIKWIPSAQQIQVDHPACFPFYDALARAHIPLLCHTGVEHVIPGGPVGLNDPRRLGPALDRGVTVIAAHLGAPMTLYERSYILQWIRLTTRYGRLFGDISALAVPFRATILKLLATRDAICSRMLYGSDYPHTAWPRLIPLHLGLRKARNLGQILNPLDKSYATVRSMGLPEQVFTRAEEVLRVA